MYYKYYKFPNKESVPNIWPQNVSVYEIGLIKSKIEVVDNFGNEIEPAEYIDGWHVNVCYTENIDLTFVEQYEINVNNPLYIWAGQQK